jgi:hypothetical protein
MHIDISFFATHEALPRRHKTDTSSYEAIIWLISAECQ